MTATVPPAHPRQQMQALRKANEIRIARARLHERMLRKEVSIDAVLSRPPKCISTMMILDLLLWVPRYGHARSMALLNRLQISAMREVGKLTPRQRREIRRMVAR